MSWKPEYALLIMFSTLVDYFSGIQIEKSIKKSRRILFLSLSIITNMGVLVFFKYFNFFSETTRQIIRTFSLSFDPITLNVILPVGISFYTFQALTYTIDIYRKEIKAEKHFGIFSTYIIFFPQLVAGPIERANNLIPQFHQIHHFDYNRLTNGLKLMLWGFFKKVVIADRLSMLVNTVYSDPTNYTGITLIVATVFFAFQIYCDFSGYTDIAIGAAQVMGFKLMDNFKRPYFSKSISEFWKRWHISLSTWFKDYVYIPLGGSRVPIPRWYFNLFIVFVISGLWHGANWTFVIWGALHGFYLIFSLVTSNYRAKFAKFIGLAKVSLAHKFIKISITFILVCVGWIFFRANSLSDAIYILMHLFPLNISLSNLAPGMEIHEFMLAIGLILFMEFIHVIQEHVGIRQFLTNKPMWVRYPLYIILILLILIFGVFTQNPFIYFQF